MYNVICKSKIINAKHTTSTWIFILSLNKYKVKALNERLMIMAMTITYRL